jgi:hypothetical protein
MTLTVVPLWFGGVSGVSNVMDVSAITVVGLIMPPDWTPAIVTIEASIDGIDFFPMYDGMGSTKLAFSVPAGAMVGIHPERLRCCNKIRLISGDRNALVPQVVPREFGLITEPKV